MSIEAINWALEIKIPPMPKLVLLSMAYVVDKSGVCEASNKDLVKYTCLSKRSVSSQIKFLTNNQIITRLGHPFSCIYNLALEKKDFKLFEHKDDGRLPGFRWQKLRQIVLKRDNRTCQYCGSTTAQLVCDHAIPLCKGGTNDLSNLITACHACNVSKGKLTIEEWNSQMERLCH